MGKATMMIRMQWRPYYLAARKRWLTFWFGPYFVRERRGIRYLIDINNYIDRQIEAWGAYEPDRLEHFIAELQDRRCEVFFDIGANLGAYSLAVAKRCVNVKIIAFEPDRRNHAQFHANLFLNGLQDRVSVHLLASSDQARTLRFHRHAAENRGRSGVALDGETVVEAISLDAFTPMSGQRVAIKIDVEGHEMAVLKGARNLLAQNTCLLQLETFEPEPVLTYLRDLGFRPVWQSGNDYVLTNFKT